jgi:hypothetical protein
VEVVLNKPNKPLNGKAYGSIPHVPSSENGGDKVIPQGQADIIFDGGRDDKDMVISTLKYDGSCTAVAKVNAEIIPLMRAGYPARESNYKQHKLFHKWVYKRFNLFDDLLDDGERIVGEWLLKAHGTRYEISDNDLLWVAFDLYVDEKRQPFGGLMNKLYGYQIWHAIHQLGSTSSVSGFGEFEKRLSCDGEHEGIVYRVEREGKVDYMAKWVRDKRDGKYLPGVSESVSDKPVWNYPPDKI